jgi:hypothetical protein
MKWSTIRTLLKNKSSIDLVARITSKSRIVHYGTPTASHKYPIFLSLTVSDRSGSVPVVLWNELAIQYFRVLELNQVVVFTQYKWKPYVIATINLTRCRRLDGVDLCFLVLFCRNSHTGEMELTCNPSGPKSVIYQMTDAQIAADNLTTHLPPIDMPLYALKHVKHLPETKAIAMQ